MKKPVLIIVNGLPASGKSTLAKRLGADLTLPVVSRDAIFQTLKNALEFPSDADPSWPGAASFKLLYAFVGTLLAARQSLIIEQFFGRPELRAAELLELQRAHDFEPVQILCQAEGSALVERYLSCIKTNESYRGLQGAEGIEQYRARMLQGELPPLGLDGPLIEVDTTGPASFDYAALLAHLAGFLQKSVL